MQPLPVTVVSGFPGAGKTALLNHLRGAAQGLRLAVVSDATRLPALLQHLATSQAFDYLLLESPGQLDPATLCEALMPEGVRARTLRIDTLVTVVDARTFVEYYSRNDYLIERGLTSQADDDRTIVDLLLEQVEFASLIVLNKTDQLPAEYVGLMTSLLRRLNPSAEVIATSFGQVPPEKALNTGWFRWPSVSDAVDAVAELDATGSSGPDEHGLSTFVYQSRRPFHPERLIRIFQTPREGLLRARGIFWLCTRMAVAGKVNLAGAILSVGSAGHWLAALPDDEAQADKHQWQAAQAIWDREWGDRRQDLVFIGMKLDLAAFRKDLDAALLTDAEMKQRPAAWAVYPDPFGVWEDETSSPATDDE